MAGSKLPKRTIKNDPFADLIPEPTTESQTMEKEEPGKATPVIAPAKSQRRAKVTVVLDGALVERIRNAAYWNPELTVAGVA
mgnify:CR=1 FL=1